MKKVWTIIALGSLISVSLFGLILMPYHSNHDIACLASLVNNAASPCPRANPLGFVNFHNDAVKKITNLILVDPISVAYLATIAALLFFSFFIVQSAGSNFVTKPISPFFRLETRNYKLTTRQLFWFALHEKRDPGSIL